MKILLTGGAGFIGSHILDNYLYAGHNILVVDNLSTGKIENIPDGVNLEQVDITDPKIETLVQEFQPEVINHQAAQIDVRRSVDDPTFDAQVNILGSLTLLEAARKVGSVKKIIFASSGGAAYGEAEQIPTSESEPVKPISPYGIAKISVEYYLHYYYHVYHIPYIALRYANVYGPRQNPHGEAGVVAIFYERMLHQKPFVINGSGEQTRDFVYVKDVAQANLASLDTDFIGALNISTCTETSINDLVSLMAQSLDLPEDIPHGPGKAGEQMRSCLTYQKAQEKLTWQPKVDLNQGLLETAAYFKTRQ